MDNWINILDSISRSLASTYRTTGPKVMNHRFGNLYGDSLRKRGRSVGGQEHPESDFGKKIQSVLHNLTPSELYEYALQEKGTLITSTGAIVSSSGVKKGRCPKDKRIVYDENTQGLWWDKCSPNKKMDTETFLINRETAICYLNNLDSTISNVILIKSNAPSSVRPASIMNKPDICVVF